MAAVQYAYPRELTDEYYASGGKITDFGHSFAGLITWLALLSIAMFAAYLAFAALQTGQIILMAMLAFFGAVLSCAWGKTILFGLYHAPAWKMEADRTHVKIYQRLPSLWVNLAMDHIVRKKREPVSAFEPRVQDILKRHRLAAYRLYALERLRQGQLPVPVMVFVPLDREADLLDLIGKLPAPEKALEEWTG